MLAGVGKAVGDVGLLCPSAHTVRTFGLSECHEITHQVSAAPGCIFSPFGECNLLVEFTKLAVWGEVCDGQAWPFQPQFHLGAAVVFYVYPGSQALSVSPSLSVKLK